MLKFGTDGIRGKVGESPLTPTEMVDVGQAIGRFFRSNGNGYVAIGRDTRPSGSAIMRQLTEGLMNTGCTVYDAGEVTTPMLARAVKATDKLRGGLMVTASHNTSEYNGVKVFDARGEKISTEMESTISSLYRAPDPLSAWVPKRSWDWLNAELVYLSGLMSRFGGEDFSEYRVLADSAAGAAYGLVGRVFTRFGVECEDIGKAPTEANINTSGAMLPQQLAGRMRARRYDLGLALDGDADRVVLVDETGRIWNGDRILSMLATNLPEEVEGVVMTQYSNGGAMRYLRRAAISVGMVQVGDREVYRACRKRGAGLGGEESGHIIYPEWLSSSDGIFVALLTLRAMRTTGKKLSELWPEYEDFPSQQQTVQDPRRVFSDDLPGWEDKLKAVKDSLAGGRILVRRSGTETDKIRVLVEAESDMEGEDAMDDLVGWLEKVLA